MSFLKKLSQNLFLLVNFSLVIVSFICLQVIYNSDIRHWISGFLGLAFPLLLILNIIFLVVYLYHKSWYFLLSFSFLMFSTPLLPRTFKFNLQKVYTKASRDFSILNYNVFYFDILNKNKPEKFNGPGIGKVLLSNETDILCLQEFYNSKSTSTIPNIEKMKKYFKYYTYMHSSSANKNASGSIGLITFSNYPIIKKKEIYWGVNENGILITDIKIGFDTLRLMNVQLRSMGIRVNRLIVNDKTKLKRETKTVLSKLKTGFEDRFFQVNQLKIEIEESPYPVIVVGDFNEVPYGYAYGNTRKLLNNAFEENGSGFGFTYRKNPNFIRIDNQFYDDKYISNKYFKTLNQYKSSDHYPLKGIYSFRY